MDHDPKEKTLKDISKGRLGRMAKLGKMAAGLAGAAAGAAGRWATTSKEAAAERLHKQAAERMLKSLGEMKGLPMKLGQLYSYLDGVVPPEYQEIYAETLGKLRTRMAPMAWEVMSAVLIEELGRPIEEVFEVFDTTPVAAASIGQVYRARLKGATGDVAVKVQYPGIADAIQADMKNADALIRTMSAVLPRVDLEQGMADLSARIDEECDYRLEGANQETFRRLWADDPEVVIPAVFESLSTERVLVTEFIEGLRWEEMLAIEPDQDERDRLGRVLFRFVFESLYRHGLFNADPHPGNYLFMADGRVVFLDFGCVQAYEPETLDGLRGLRDHVITGVSDEALKVSIMASMGVTDVYDDEMWKVLEEYARFCFEPLAADQPFRFTRAYTSQITKMTMDAKMALMKRLFKTGLVEPKMQGFAFLNRIIFGLASLLSHLEAQADWRALTAECEAEGRSVAGLAATAP